MLCTILIALDFPNCRGLIINAIDKEGQVKLEANSYWLVIKDYFSPVRNKKHTHTHYVYNNKIRSIYTYRPQFN